MMMSFIFLLKFAQKKERNMYSHIVELPEELQEKVGNRLCDLHKRIDEQDEDVQSLIVRTGEYDAMLPMDIYGEFLIKAIISGDIDKMEQLGIYEIAPEDFALAEFADTSKLELQHIVRVGLDKLRAEMS